MSETTPEKQNGRKGTGKMPVPGTTRAGRRMLYLLLGLSFALIAFLAVLYPIVIKRTDHAEVIYIPRGATEKSVADSLSKYYDEGFTSWVMRLTHLRRIDFTRRYGRYEIPAGSNALSAMRKLTSGPQSPVRLTINGFRDLDILIDRISRKLNFPADSLRMALKDPKVLSAYGLNPSNAMALFMDDTYEVYWTASPSEVIKKIGDSYNFFWSTGRKRRAADQGLTPAEAMILGSIVDEETNDESEKGTIGQLYINRLNSGMRLQADPTVRFAIGDFSIRRVSAANTRFDSPYNTYIHNGLPPGPIRTTSVNTLKAILDSPPNNYMYMCAKEDFSGAHNFSSTYEEHLENAARYQAALDRRGITVK